MATAIIKDVLEHNTLAIKSKDIHRTKIGYKEQRISINEVLPFRVKFINIGIEAYGPNNVPPIPLQVIGYSNYIL
jgi:hypothetical protein